MNNKAHRILVVEDDTVQRGVIEDILVQAAYEVRSVGSAPEGLAHLRADAFSLMLTDLRMRFVTASRSSWAGRPTCPTTWSRGRCAESAYGSDHGSVQSPSG